MFGYVTPCKMELKIKDFEKFKAYYCGLCREIKKSFGNVPRLALNYDMAFLAVLLDSLENSRNKLTKVFCCFHPTEKRLVFIENSALKYAAFCNVILTYYKLLDNINDDNSKLSKIYSSILNIYLKKAPEHYRLNAAFIEQCLSRLYSAEKSASGKTLDELSHHFADLTGLILSSYNIKHEDSKALYWLGYNLGKWIYIIDAYDDLKKDMEKKKFNAINAAFNSENLTYSDFVNSYSSRIEFILTICAQSCLEYLNNISVKKNYDLLHNILQFGLMEKMDKVFKRDLGGILNEKSL